MISKGQKIKLGLFLVAATALLVGTLAVFAGMRFWRDRDHYVVLCRDSVSGLSPGAAVQLHGVRVGSVSDVRLTGEPEIPVKVSILVDPSTRIRADARALLRMHGITGLKYIDIAGGSAAAPVLAPGEAIEVGRTALDQLERDAVDIASRTSALLDKSERLADNLIEITGPDNRRNLEVMLAEGARAARGLGDASDRVAASGAGLDRLLREARASLRASTAQVARAVDRVDALAASADEMVGEGADLLRDTRRMLARSETDVRRSLADLRVAMRTVEQLVGSMRDDPSRLLMTRPPKERRLP